MNKKCSFALSTMIALSSATAMADGGFTGCYEPKRGFATSICTDVVNCTTQAGVYQIELRNPSADADKKKLVIGGLFEGMFTPPEPDDFRGCNQTIDHRLKDVRTGSVIATDQDCAFFTGQTPDGKIELIEILNIVQGSGAFANLIGGQVTLVGTIDPASGINSFTVEKGSGQVCFAE